MILEIEKITKSFGALNVLSDINLAVEEGLITSIIGPNGAGKTTLFNVITGLYRPDSGQVHFRGKDITGLKPNRITRRGLARSFQITNIFPGLSVWENIALAAQTVSNRRMSMFSTTNRLEDINRQVDEIVDLIGLKEYARELAGTLSHGDQRHLEIGMTLATGPQLLMLDEPTSGMSPAESLSTIGLIETLRQKVTILIIEHDMDLVMKLSDQIIVLNFGRKIAEGPSADISRDPEVRRVYLGEA